jgi:hypothetical protein
VVSAVTKSRLVKITDTFAPTHEAIQIQCQISAHSDSRQQTKANILLRFSAVIFLVAGHLAPSGPGARH